MAKSSTPRSTSKKKNGPKKKKQQKKEAAPKTASGKAAAGDRSAPIPEPEAVAPPSQADLQESASARDLIFKKIDLTAPPAPEPAVREKKKPVKAPVPIRDLIFKKFPEWKSEKTYAPPVSAAAPMEAPPFVAAGSREESERIRALLFRKIDLTAPPAPKPTEPEKAETPDLQIAVEPAIPPEIPVAATPPPPERLAAAAAPKPPPAEEKAPPAAEAISPGEVKAPEKPAEPEKPAPPRIVTPLKPIETEKKETPKVTITYESTEMKGPAPMDKTMKYLIAGFALMVLLVVGASFSNMNAYQIKKLNKGVEIWQGRFAPMGSGPMLALSDAVAPKQTDRVFSKSEIYPYICNYYVQKADDLLKTGGIPDFEQIRAYLDKAFAYANTQSLRNTIAKRMAGIDLMMLVYRADVAASKGTVQELEAALGHLKKASGLDLDETQDNLVAQKIENIRKMLEKAAPPAPKAGPSK